MNPRSMPQPDHNNRETGARKYPASKAQPAETDTHADTPSINPFGITQPSDETMDETRQSDGIDRSGRATTSPATEKVVGAGPAIAEHSKDAKAPKGGRQPSAYVKH